jgi:hypothetical protein
MYWLFEKDWKGLLCQASRNEKTSHQLLMLSRLRLRINAAPMQNQNQRCIKLHSRTSLHFCIGQALSTFQLQLARKESQTITNSKRLSLPRLVSYWSSARSESVKYVFGTWCHWAKARNESRCIKVRTYYWSVTRNDLHSQDLSSAHFMNASLPVPIWCKERKAWSPLAEQDGSETG